MLFILTLTDGADSALVGQFVCTLLCRTSFKCVACFCVLSSSSFIHPRSHSSVRIREVAEDISRKGESICLGVIRCLIPPCTCLHRGRRTKLLLGLFTSYSSSSSSSTPCPIFSLSHPPKWKGYSCSVMFAIYCPRVVWLAAVPFCREAVCVASGSLLLCSHYS